MKALWIPLLALTACTLIPTSISDATIEGRWRGPTTWFHADEFSATVYAGSSTGYSYKPVSIDPWGKFQIAGSWGDNARPAWFIGRVNVHTDRMLLIVADSVSGERYLTEWLVADHSPIPPPPAPPPPP